MARPVSRLSVNWQDCNIMVKSIDQSLNSCESMVQSRVQSPGFVNTSSGIINAKQKHLGCIKGKANQKQQLSDHTCNQKL